MSKKLIEKDPAKTKWAVSLNGGTAFAMVGTKLKACEAIEFARGIWPRDKIEVS